MVTGTGIAAALAMVAAHLTVNATAAEDGAYEWENVEIVGGGFVPNIIFNATEPDLIYARTDVGGAYRWHEDSQHWEPLLDWIGWDEWGWNGVSSLATDPVDPDRLYVAAGMYTNDWDPNNGAILRSDDRGETWEASPLPFKLGGNMPGRGMGERLRVDPNDNSVVYFGAPEGNGLWRSTDSGVTWDPVESFPNPGGWSEDPDGPYGYLSHEPGVVWVTFDPRTGTPGEPTQTIYAGVADPDNTVYRSTDGGQSWHRLEDQPTGFMAQQGVLDEDGGYLYIATSDNGGPYAGDDGAVWRFDTATGEWTEITPLPFGGDDPYFGYAGLSIDRQDPDTIMVTGYSSWWPDTWIFRSTDRGETWQSFYDVSWPERDNHYTLDISAAPWLDFGGGQPEPPEETPKLGWMTQGLAIDPHDSDRMMYGTGATIYGTTNLTALDSGGSVDLRVMAHGLEETAANALVKPPGGDLLSGLGDIGGFRHTDLDQVPPSMHQQPYHDNTTSMDFAQGEPEWIVRVGDTGDDADDGTSHIGYSSDGGASWWPGSEPGGVTGGGSVAINADASGVVWSPDGAGVHYSTSVGGAFTPSTGVPDGAKVAADRVDPDTFYAYANGSFYVSDDAGETFTETATGVPDDGFVGFSAVPGSRGHVWLAGETGLLRSTDGGETFTPLPEITWAYNVGFGAPAPGASHPTVYTVATIDGVTGLFRSDDAGASWVRINDDEHQWGNMGAALTGDPEIYGRVYLGTNGRGVMYGEPDGTNPSPTPSPTPTPTTPGPPGECTVHYDIAGEWDGGFQGNVTVTNESGSAVDGWTLEWSFPADQQITQLWGGHYTQTGADVSVTDDGWNATIEPGDTVSFGFLASWDRSNPEPTEFTLDGQPCTSESG
ncbi:xyloglucanase [Actinobacteria bacterium YIM 96077]|uniref:Xyloglucanase n=1 Tax=Phytoactinopolyspora halophila TaxID=1981511 RepID=A0A329R0V8_9ACTN|nr:xyloglucanase [Actinobacteria bacterium YIM 96077]RAW18177.1 xyloglucanase [Phytoactinopolyspora halophila]